MNKTSKRGASMIMAIMIMLILGSIMAGLTTLTRRAVVSGQEIVMTDDVFFLSESGIETGINWLVNYDADLNWYNNAEADGTLKPNISYTLGSDLNVDLSVQYPATCLSSNIDNPLSATYIEVYSIDPFDEFGQIDISEYFYVMIGNDVLRITQYVSSSMRMDLYLGIDPITELDDTHSVGDKVYPLSVLEADIDDLSTSLTVSNTRGFLPAGTIKLMNLDSGDFELIQYSNKTQTSFDGCIRGANGTTAIDPSLLEVTNNRIRMIPVDYESTLISVGSSKGLSKTLEVTIQYQDW